MVSRQIATVLGGIAIGALALTTAPAYADATSGHTAASVKSSPTYSRATQIVGFNATPNRVRKGNRLFLHGTLRSRWDHGRGLSRERIQIYFRPSGSKNWRRTDTTVTRSNGTFSTQVRAYQSGTWSARFDSSRLGDSKADDYVKVVR